MSLDEDGELLSGDDKTLRMSAPQLDADRLERFLVYQRSTLETLRAVDPALLGSSAIWERMVAKAHQEAVARAGLDAGDLSRLEALCRDFCAWRESAAQLAAKLQLLRDRAPAGDARARDLAAAQQSKLRAELARKESLAGLIRRYGQQTIALLRTREDELRALHRELQESAR